MLTDINTYLNGTGNSGNPATYQPSDSTSDGENFTNWEAGLAKAQPGPADLVVFITDGVPNTVGTAGNSPTNNGGGSDASAAAAFEEAQAIRASNTKLLGIGVGQVTGSGNLSRLTQIVEPNNPQVWNGTGTLDISTVDVISVPNFDNLDDALRQVVFALCSPSVSVTKVDQDGAPVADLDFTGTVQVTQSGQAANDYEWVSPDLGLAASAGTSQTVTTNSSGVSLFQWIPNTVADPEPWTSSFTFSEQLAGDFAGWTLPQSQPDCSVDRLLTNPTPGGPITQTFAVQLQASGPDQAGTVNFSLLQNGQPFQIQKADIVRCTVVNHEPATITVVKNVVNDGPDGRTFDFTGSLGAFTLDPAGTASKTFTVAPGTYSVTETNPSVQSYQLTNLSCAQVSGQASGIPSVPNRTASITVAAGSSITCTFTNTEVPVRDLTITKTPSTPDFPEQDASVTYTVSITNPNGAANPVTITSITDSATLENGPAVGITLGSTPAPTFPQAYPGGQVTGSTCQGLIGTQVAGAPVSCSFTVQFTDRNAGDDIDDTVTVSGTDKLGLTLSRTASASVDVTPVPPQIQVDKQNKPNESIVAPGGDATYTIEVTNPGTVEDLILTGISDVMTVNSAPFMTLDLTTTAPPLVTNTCTDLVGTVLVPGASYSCEFSVTVSGLSQGDELVNTATVHGRDDDPTPQTVSDDDPATRTILGEPPAITVFKTDNDETIAEPGENIVYDIDISNQSTTESVTITQVTDEVYFTPAGGTRVLVGTLVVTDGSVVWTPAADNQGAGFVGTTCDVDDADGGIGTVLAVKGTTGDTTSCTITLSLPGDAGDKYDDKVIVDGVDEIGNNPVQAENTAETPVVDVLPEIVVTKSASPLSVPEYGPEADRTVTFTVVVTNDSVSTDPLTITSLDDSDFGDLLTDDGNGLITSNSCDDVLAGLVLAPGTSSTPCTFTAVLSAPWPLHNNVVTVQAVDDEQNTAPTTTTRPSRSHRRRPCDRRDQGLRRRPRCPSSAATSRTSSRCATTPASRSSSPASSTTSSVTWTASAIACRPTATSTTPPTSGSNSTRAKRTRAPSRSSSSRIR
ncbi:MAG: hypothetical protein R2697_16420 [Ilumatobacteraceae bacterium]